MLPFLNIAIGKAVKCYCSLLHIHLCIVSCGVGSQFLIAFSLVVSFWPIHPTCTGQWQWIRQLLYLSSHLRPLVCISTQHKAVYTTICCEGSETTNFYSLPCGYSVLFTDIAIWLYSNISKIGPPSKISPSLFFEWSCCFLSKYDHLFMLQYMLLSWSTEEAALCKTRD